MRPTPAVRASSPCTIDITQVSQLRQRKTWYSRREEQPIVLHQGWYYRGVDEFEQEQWIHGLVRHRLAV